MKSTEDKRNAAPQNQASLAPEAQPAEKDQIPINGFKQIIDMLRVADPTFRASLLKRIAQRDPEMARSLIRSLESL